MPDNDSETLPKDEAPAAASAKSLRGERILAELAFARSAFLSIAIVLAVTSILIVTIQDLMRAPVVLEEISVPEKLREQGYTGLVSSNLLWDAIEDIRNATGDREKRVRIQTASRQLDVVEPASGLSLQRLTQVLRALFNLPQTRISGEFACPVSVNACTSKEMALKVRIYTGQGTRVIRTDPIGTDTIEDYFHKAALRVLSEEIDPLVAAQ